MGSVVRRNMRTMAYGRRLSAKQRALMHMVLCFQAGLDALSGLKRKMQGLPPVKIWWELPFYESREHYRQDRNVRKMLRRARRA